MSAIHMVCPACGETYIAGVVGSTPWPPHECPLKARVAELESEVDEAYARAVSDVVEELRAWANEADTGRRGAAAVAGTIAGVALRIEREHRAQQ